MNLLTRMYWSAYLAYHLRGQPQYPFKPLADIRRDQARRVRRMVAYAYRHVPYYRETMDRLSLRPADFQVADDLAKLPVLERCQIQKDPEYFVSKAQPLEHYLRLRSGGSTGAPCTIYQDPRALFQNRARGERESPILTRLIGRPWGYRQVTMGSPFGQERKMDRFMRTRCLTPPGMSIQRHSLSLLDPPEDNVERINALRPDLLYSFGSYLEILFAYLEATGETFYRPKVIVYTSDGLSASVRQLIEQQYQIPVLSTYQAIETLKMAFECEEHQGLHISIDVNPIRIVDAAGRSLPPGQSGDVVVSNLVNRATVLLNYRLGDVASLRPHPCPCGRSLPLLSFPQGRSDDLVKLPGGRLMHPQAIRIIFTNETEVWQYQVVQEKETLFRIAIVAAESCDQAVTSARIAEGFARTFGPDITVDIAFVDSIPRTAGGKVRPVLSMRQRSVITGQRDDE